MAADRKPTDFLCLAMSRDGYICNEPPAHAGDHVAKAGLSRREVRRWPRMHSASSEAAS